ncbi:MAG: DUF1573 domain-containing protein [Bacteroidia bacterium]|nr:DUF1573 domain-containing protein [Bacteroidia bacterium]
MGIKSLISYLFVAAPLFMACDGRQSADANVSGAQATEGRVELEKEAIDFGSVQTGDVLSKRLRVRNLSDRVVHINGVTASCECTQPFAPNPDIAPGEVVAIEVMLDTRGLIGRQYHKVSVYTDIDTCDFVVMAEIR